MSRMALKWCLSLDCLRGNEFAVLHYLSRCHNAKTGECFPSNRTIAEKCNLHPRTVPKIIRRLEKKNVVERYCSFMVENNRQSSNQFRLNLENKADFKLSTKCSKSFGSSKKGIPPMPKRHAPPSSFFIYTLNKKYNRSSQRLFGPVDKFIKTQEEIDRMKKTAPEFTFVKHEHDSVPPAEVHMSFNFGTRVFQLSKSEFAEMQERFKFIDVHEFLTFLSEYWAADPAAQAKGYNARKRIYNNCMRENEKVRLGGYSIHAKDRIEENKARSATKKYEPTQAALDAFSVFVHALKGAKESREKVSRSEWVRDFVYKKGGYEAINRSWWDKEADVRLEFCQLYEKHHRS